MILQGRNLELNMRGDDVSLLQDELRQLGFIIDESEAIFGSTTLLAVENFQRQRDLRVNGAVDAITARAINAEVDALSDDQYLVKGTVVSVDGSPVVRARVALHEKKLRSEEFLGINGVRLD
jgi:peptidoglycan hydrolase-like protein with peptidoglycan-binding domain